MEITQKARELIEACVAFLDHLELAYLYATPSPHRSSAHHGSSLEGGTAISKVINDDIAVTENLSSRGRESAGRDHDYRRVVLVRLYHSARHIPQLYAEATDGAGESHQALAASGAAEVRKLAHRIATSHGLGGYAEGNLVITELPGEEHEIAVEGGAGPSAWPTALRILQELDQHCGFAERHQLVSMLRSVAPSSDGRHASLEQAGEGAQWNNSPPTKVERAIYLLSRRHWRSLSEVSRAVPCSHSTLSRSKAFNRAWALHQQRHLGSIPRGEKRPDGSIEAFDESD